MARIQLNIKPSVFLPCYYPDLEDYANRYQLFWGGRGSGKSKYVCQKLLLKGLKEKRLILLMRKQTNQLRDSVWKDMLETISEFGLSKYFETNKTEFRITCKLNGTEFKCLGLDEAEKIKGFTAISDVFLDEITAFTPDDFELIDGTLRTKSYKLPLQLYACFNPVSKANWVYKYFGFDTGIVPPHTKIQHTTYLDNPFLDDSFHLRMEALKQRDYKRWKIDALGEFVSLDKLIFNNWKVEEFDSTKTAGTLICGLDFGYINDISAFTASLLDEENKKIYIFKEWGDTGKTNQELAKIITSLGFSKSTIIADSAENKSIEEIRREGIVRIKPAAKGKDSILFGIQKLQNYDIIIHPSCEGVITEFENYSWKRDKSSGEYINTPIDEFNHYIDSLRYSLQCVDNSRKLQTLSKSQLSL